MYNLFPVYYSKCVDFNINIYLQNASFLDANFLIRLRSLNEAYDIY